MHVQEKRAWYMLSVAGGTMLLFGIMTLILGPNPGNVGLFGFLGLMGFGPLIGDKERRGMKLLFDERDQQISARSTFVAFSVFWVLFLLAMILPMFVLGLDGVVTLRAATLGHIGCVALALVIGVQSLVTVVMYRRGDVGGE